MSRYPLPRDDVDFSDNRETQSSSMDHITIPPHCIQCPYKAEHKVPVQDFNDHIFKCRAEKMRFYPHTLVMERCKHNRLHFLPQEEIPFHEQFCKEQKLPKAVQKFLNAPTIEMNVDDMRRTEQMLKELDRESESETSVIEDSEPEDEDRFETIKRLQMLKFEKEIFNRDNDSDAMMRNN